MSKKGKAPPARQRPGVTQEVLDYWAEWERKLAAGERIQFTYRPRPNENSRRALATFKAIAPGAFRLREYPEDAGAKPNKRGVGRPVTRGGRGSFRDLDDDDVDMLEVAEPMPREEELDDE